jgi:hypothetical protein
MFNTKIIIFCLGISALVNQKVDVSTDNDQSKFHIDYVLAYKDDTKIDNEDHESNEDFKKNKGEIKQQRKNFQNFLQSTLGLRLRESVSHSKNIMKPFLSIFIDPSLHLSTRLSTFVLKLHLTVY